MTNDNKISSLGTRQDILLDQVSRKENSRWCMKYLTWSSETTYQCLFIHTWRIYRSLACNPSALINTRMFYPTSKWQIMMNVKAERNAVYTMFQRNYGWTIGPKLPITVVLPQWEEIHYNWHKLSIETLEPNGESPNDLTTREVVIPRGSHDGIILDKLLPEIIIKGMQFRCKYNNHGISG